MYPLMSAGFQRVFKEGQGFEAAVFYSKNEIKTQI